MANSEENTRKKRMTDKNKSLNHFFLENKFVGSYNNMEIIPNSNLSEVCFVGRSNVGKSSIINSICKTKKLTRTSKTPGRTISINIFNISKILHIADMPGYGYAKISKKFREELKNLTSTYIYNRKNLKHIFVLIDTKVGLKGSDIDMLDIITESKKKFSIILTKIDKCSENHANNQIKSILSLMKNYSKNFYEILLSSSKNNYGIVEIQKKLFGLTK